MREHNGILSDEITHKPCSDGECSHISHDKNSPRYNTLHNGYYVSKETHAEQHEDEEDPYLKPHQNAWAARQIRKRIK